MNLEGDNIAGFHRNWTEADVLDSPRQFAGDIADQGRSLSEPVGDSCRDHENNVENAAKSRMEQGVRSVSRRGAGRGTIAISMG